MRKQYLEEIKESWATILAHVYMGWAFYMFVPSAIGIICMAPIFLYAYVAWSRDHEGFAMGFVIGEKVNEDLVEAIAEDMCERCGGDVQVIIVKDQHLDQLREELLRDDDDEENQDV